MHKTTLTVLEGWAHPGQSARVGVSPEKRPRGVHLLTSDPVALLYHMAKGSQAVDEVQLPISQSEVGGYPRLSGGYNIITGPLTWRREAGEPCQSDETDKDSTGHCPL